MGAHDFEILLVTIAGIGSLFNILVKRSLAAMDHCQETVADHATRIALLEDWRTRTEVPEAWRG